MIIDYKDRLNSRCRFSIDENGEYNGLFRYWHPNGNLSYELNYKNGKRHGLYRSWHHNGQLSFEAKYKNGVLIF